MGLRSLPALILVSACQAAAPSGGGETVQITSVSGGHPDGSSGTGGDETSGSSGADDNGSAGASSGGVVDETTTPAVLDVGSGDDLGDGTPAGCKGKIDLLFVVSREVSMYWEQEKLVVAFPKFFATIQSRFADFDYHIMVIDSDVEWGLSTCDEKCAEQGWCKLESENADYPCGLLDTVTECDRTMGAGNVFQAGGYAANQPCGVDGGRRYLTREQTDLAETFACIARVGISGREKMGEALMAAMSPQLNWPGACNDGFLRDDALLMVTLIGGYDYGPVHSSSAGFPALWAEAVVAAKHGDPNAAVVLAIGDGECPEYMDRVCVMATMFPYHHIGDLDALDYGPDFEVATELIELACAGYAPPG